MKIFKILFILVLGFNSFNICAQQAVSQKKDVYFLLDTLNTPSLNRIFDHVNEADIQIYTLHCRCFPSNRNPAFMSTRKSLTEAKTIDKKELDAIEKTSLTELIDIATNVGINKKVLYNFYFILNEGQNFKVLELRLHPPIVSTKTTTVEKIAPVKQ